MGGLGLRVVGAVGGDGGGEDDAAGVGGGDHLSGSGVSGWRTQVC